MSTKRFPTLLTFEAAKIAGGHATSKLAVINVVRRLATKLLLQLLAILIRFDKNSYSLVLFYVLWFELLSK